MVVLNIALIYKIIDQNLFTKKNILNNSVESSIKGVVAIDTLTMENVFTGKMENIKYNKPAIILLFSKENCTNCLFKIFDKIASIESDNLNKYFISNGFNDGNEILSLLTKHRNLPNLFLLKKIKFSHTRFKPSYPTVLLINERGEIMLHENIMSGDEGINEELFWRQLEFMFFKKTT